MNKVDKTPATEESIWALFREADRQRKEAEEKSNREMAEFRNSMAESSARFDREMAEFRNSIAEDRKARAESSARFDKQIKQINESIGGISNNTGYFAEEYFFNSFENGEKNFFGEKFDEIEKNVKGIEPGFKDEYDILLINGKSLGLIEVKYKGRKEDVPTIVRKARTFRVNFPKYQNHQVYLAMAAMIFNKEVEQECIEKGIAIVKQVGDTVVINDTNLKIF